MIKEFPTLSHRFLAAEENVIKRQELAVDGVRDEELDDLAP